MAVGVALSSNVVCPDKGSLRNQKLVDWKPGQTATIAEFIRGFERELDYPKLGAFRMNDAERTESKVFRSATTAFLSASGKRLFLPGTELVFASFTSDSHPTVRLNPWPNTHTHTHTQLQFPGSNHMSGNFLAFI
jgi:hypothetical protein